MSATHPAFEQAPESHRWAGPLEELWSVLRKEAYRIAPDTPAGQERWAWFVLPRGALVALRIRPDFRKELRIARGERPETADAWLRCEREIETFLEHFGGRWQRVDEQASRGVAVRFVELYSNEHAVNRARCTACGAETPSTPILSPMLCPDCARARRRSPQRELELVR